jgi:tripartite-type tricarboxylate transporter receptor subunit TctC
MFRIFLIFVLLLFSSAAYSAETVNVYSRYSAGSVVTQNLVATLEALNKIQNKYEFRYSHVPGAEGETANISSIERARAGTKLLWMGAVSTFTYSRLENKNRKWNEDTDFIFLNGMSSGSGPAILVSKDFKGNLIDLINLINKKDTVYFATNSNTVTNVYLNNVFTKKYSFNEKAKILSYGNIHDISASVQRYEADYTVFSTADMPALKPLMFAAEERSPEWPDVPTGKEMGFPEFTHSAMNFFAVPKELKEFGDELLPYFKKLCGDESLAERIRARAYSAKPLCYDGAKIKTIIDTEYSRLLKNSM